MILVLDSDVPWIHATSRPAPDAAIYVVDIDPVKADMAMWHVPARRIAGADSKVAVEQITQFVRDHVLAARRPGRGPVGRRPRTPAGPGGPRSMPRSSPRPA